VLLKRARLNLGSDIRVHKLLFWLHLVVKEVNAAIYFLCNDRVLMSCVMIRIPRLIKVFLECIVILKYSKLDDILMVLVSLPHRNEP
jgi:tryptophan 2,3-dioxygenase